MLHPSPRLTRPGLFVTGTDTGVGKTLVTCAIAAALRSQDPRFADGRLGVCKPMASGCRRDREGLVSSDAEALAYYADCRQPLDVVNPIRFVPPLAPAVAAEQAGEPVDWDALRRALGVLDASSEGLLVEGVGGLFVPLDPAKPKETVLDLARVLDYPVVIVARSVLGTLNHAAMTAKLLKTAGCRVAGIVMNGYDADVAVQEDPSVASNRVWLEKLTGLKVLTVVPKVAAAEAVPEKGRLSAEVIEALKLVYWPDVMRSPRQGDV